MDETRKEFRVQIYATDLDDDAISSARSGSYPAIVTADVTPERLRRFFTKEDDGSYKVKKNIREMVVFAIQSVIKDPPFTRLDLLSCRNLLIYLEPEQQNRLIPNFHYALKPGGVLFLSSSETITIHPELFSSINRKWKFYRASHTTARARVPVFELSPFLEKINKAPDDVVISKAKPGTIADLSNRTLLQFYAPASVTTDAKGNILHVHGDTSKYLRPPPGPVTTNVVEMAREDLQLDLREALNTAARGVSTLNREASIMADGVRSTVSFSVRLLPQYRGTAGAEAAPASGENLLLVSFQDIAVTDTPAAGRTGGQRTRRGKHAMAPDGEGRPDHVARLERELAYAKENVQANSEEQQATNEELKSSNEELQSTNEELQSANEELETSKEELQSLNEETITVNAELNARIEQLNRVQNDMKNLLDNINVGTLFLDQHLVIRRYTREALSIYRLIPTDVGRPLGDIVSNIEGKNLKSEMQTVLDTLIPCEREVRAGNDAWFLVRIQPYRTLENVIEGVVLTFTDITVLKRTGEAVKCSEALLAAAQVLAEGIVNTVSEPLIVLDGGLQVISASRSFYAHFQVAAEQTVGRKIYELGNGQWDIPALRDLLENILPRDQTLDGYVVQHDFPGLGPHRMVLNARRIVTAAGNTELILLAMVALEALEALKTP